MGIGIRLKNWMRSMLRPIIRPIWYRVQLRMNAHLDGRMVSLVDGRIASAVDSRVASLLDSRLEAHVDSRVAALVDSRMVSFVDGRMVSFIEGRMASLVDDRVASAVEARKAPQDQSWTVHAPAFLNAVSTVGAFGHRLSALSRDVDGLSRQVQQLTQASAPSQQFLADASADIPRLWDRIEFVRREILFEMAHGARTSAGRDAPEPKIIDTAKVEAALASGNVRLNLGCGHVALPDYINVDMRELPGVDIVAAADQLPFEAGSVSEIFSAHLVEHFSQEAMRRRLLPYWMSLLKSGGVFHAITPDAAAMVKAAATSEYDFEDFREVLFGAQDYEGDYHYNLFTPDSMTTLLAECGLTDITVPVSGRRNGKCYEFEIRGRYS